MRWNRGYTLVEVMMFLAVSSGFLVIAMVGVSQRQRNTEFTAEMREIENRIKGVFSDTKNGYFDNLSDLKCSVSGASVSVGPSPGSQLGSDNQCVFLGKVIAFGDSASEDDRSAFRVYTIVGARPGLNSIPSNAGLNSVDPTVASQLTQTGTLRYGVLVSNRTETRYSNMIGAINGLLATNQEPRTFARGTIWGIAGQTTDLENPANLSSGLTLSANEIICFEERGGDKSAQITIGRNGQQFTTELEYRDCEV